MEITLEQGKLYRDSSDGCILVFICDIPNTKEGFFRDPWSCLTDCPIWIDKSLMEEIDPSELGMIKCTL